MNVFDFIRDKSKFAKKELEGKLDYAKQKLAEKDVKFAELEQKVAEFETLFKDKRYVKYSEFVSSLKSELYSAMQTIALNSTNKDEMVLSLARISAQLELLEYLVTTPRLIVKQLKKNIAGSL